MVSEGGQRGVVGRFSKSGTSLRLAAAAAAWTSVALAEATAPPLGIVCRHGDRPYRISIWHGERRDGKLRAMYEPIVSTLRAGLGSRAAECGYSVDESVLGPSVSSSSSSPKKKKKKKTWSESLGESARRLEAGDVVVWVGVAFQEGFMLGVGKRLADRGVRIVSYHTEPTALKAYPGTVAEYWTYTQHHRSARFVPPGFVDRGILRHLPRPSPATLLWLGGPRCIDKLPQDVRARVEARYDVWGLKAWRDVASRNGTVYLDMHGRCGRHQDPLETFRLSQILSLGGVVVAEPSNPDDEACYRDMVIFETDFYNTEAGWSHPTLSLLHDADRLLAFRDNAFRLFKRRFDPRALLTRADVWNERTSSSSSSAPLAHPHDNRRSPGGRVASSLLSGNSHLPENNNDNDNNSYHNGSRSAVGSCSFL